MGSGYGVVVVPYHSYIQQLNAHRLVGSIRIQRLNAIVAWYHSCTTCFSYKMIKHKKFNIKCHDYKWDILNKKENSRYYCWHIWVCHGRFLHNIKKIFTKKKWWNKIYLKRTKCMPICKHVFNVKGERFFLRNEWSLGTQRGL